MYGWVCSHLCHIDRGQKRPGRGMLLQVTMQLSQRGIEHFVTLSGCDLGCCVGWAPSRLLHSGNIPDRDGLAGLKHSEPRESLVPSLSGLDRMYHCRTLPSNHLWEAQVVDTRVEHTLHLRPPIVILDVAVSGALRQCNRLGKPLLAKVSNRVIISVPAIGRMA
jgi:hypothetical protein